MSNIFTIVKKELKRFFTDKRMLLSLILPGIMIFLVYSLMGSFMGDAMTTDKNYTYTVYVENQVEEFKKFNVSEDYKIEIKEDFKDSLDDIKTKIKNKEIDLFISFEENFTEKLNNGQTPQVAMYYDSTSVESQEIYTYYYTSLFTASTEIKYNFLINMDPSISYNLATEEDISKMMVTMLLPFLLIVLLFSGCMAIATESIAGEKERGTIATLLVTPVKRSHLALGKIIALSLTSLVSAVASFIGVIASLPKLLQSASGEGAISLQMYGIETYIGAFFIIIVTVMLFTTLLSIISTFAKSIKEAGQYAIPVMVVTMIIGITSMLSMGGSSTAWYLYLIPIYNSVQCLSGIFALSFDLVGFLITILSNIVFIGLGIFIITKMFDSEKIIFNK